MQVYKFKCDNCGSTSCDKIDDTTYKCIFCGREQRIFIEKQKVSDEEFMSSGSETEENKNGDKTKNSEENKSDDSNKNAKSDLNINKFTDSCKDLYKNNKSLVLLLVCLFVGYLGMHKFLQGEILMGIVYFFTGGLFGIGWIIDIVKCTINCIKEFNKN